MSGKEPAFPESGLTGGFRLYKFRIQCEASMRCGRKENSAQGQVLFLGSARNGREDLSRTQATCRHSGPTPQSPAPSFQVSLQPFVLLLLFPALSPRARGEERCLL